MTGPLSRLRASLRALGARLRRVPAAASRLRPGASPPSRIPEPAPATGPAGIDTTEAQGATEPGFRERGRLRRRLRYLRRVRELGFRDLGGLVFDLHRFGRQGDHLVAQKLHALAAVDQELRALERALHDERPFHELREPGIAACPRCSAIHGSDARFCPACGAGLRGPQAVAEIGDAGGAQPMPTTPTGTAPTTPAADESASTAQTQAIPIVESDSSDPRAATHEDHATGGGEAAEDLPPGSTS